MMDMLGAYSVGSFEMRLLTYNFQVSPDTQGDIDDVCLTCFTKHSSDWLDIDFGFHACSSNKSDSVQVS